MSGLFLLCLQIGLQLSLLGLPLGDVGSHLMKPQVRVENEFLKRHENGGKHQLAGLPECHSNSLGAEYETASDCFGTDCATN